MPRAFVALLVGWLALAFARAQEGVVVHTVDAREVVTVRSLAFPGAAAPGGFGFVLVTAENRDAVGHQVRIELASRSWGSSTIAVQRELLLGPNELARCYLPLPTNADRDLAFDVRVDRALYPGSIGGRRRDAPVGLLISDRGDAEPWGLSVVQAFQGGKKPLAEIVPIAPGDAPADWRLFTGFHVVVVDGRAPVAEDVQDAIVRFASTGGNVVLSHPERLPAGALRERCGRTDAGGRVRCGLGNCVVVPFAGDPIVGGADSLHERLRALPPAEAAIWPAADVLLGTQEVPGLGDAPVIGFLVVILVFAFVAGPVNFLLLRRWRRPLLVLVTVPACGLGTTLLMLGYGVVHDGFGVRGAIHSWTLLDQERHEATSFAARTLFAGLAPDLLTMAPDGVLIAPRAAARSDRRDPDRWQFDPVGNVLDGGVLPSRQATPLLSARHGIARQRLRVRVAGDQLELLADGGVTPVGEVLLRDGYGRLWLGTAPHLAPVGDTAARNALDRWMRAAAELTSADGTGQDFTYAHGLVERLLGGRELPAGTYVLRSATAPWLDEHGLRVAYDRVEHFVAGRLAAEDFVR